MGEQRNLTEENVEELKKHLEQMKNENPDLEYRFFAQREEESLQDVEIRRLKEELSDIENRLNVKDPFLWMRKWLEAYARKNDGCDVEKIMDWIYQQPMTGG